MLRTLPGMSAYCSCSCIRCCTNVKTDPLHAEPKIQGSEKQQVGRIQWNPELSAELADRRVILRVNSEQQLHIWGIPLDLVKLVDIINSRKGHAIFAGDPDGRLWLARMSKDDPGRVDSQAQNKLDIR